MFSVLLPYFYSILYKTTLSQGPRLEDRRPLVGLLGIHFDKRVEVGQSSKTFGYGCTSCWGDVGAGDAEADVIYISFIVSVQYIEYLRTTDPMGTVLERII